MNKNICSCVVFISIACLMCTDARMYEYTRSKNFYKVNWNDFMAKATRGTNELIKMSTPYVLENYPTGNVSEECTKALFTYVDGIKNWKRWAIRMFDATGKIPSSFKKGAGIEFGSYDDCLRIEGPPTSNGPFSGQFCMLHIQASSAAFLLEEGTPFKKYASYLVPNLESSKRMLNWHLGMCTPSSCSELDLYNILTSLIKFENVSVSISNCEKKGPKEWTEPTKFAISALVCLLGLSLVGTVLDFKGQKHTGDERSNTGFFRQSLESFSIRSNTERLFDKNQVGVDIRRICGVLFVLCCCVIVCNVIVYPTPWKEMRYTSFGDMSMAVGFADRFVVAMDALFFTSGFLSVYLLWRIMEKSEGITRIFSDIFKCYFRLSAINAFIVLLSFALPLIYDGPLWNQTWNNELAKCKNNGWTNVLNVQAYFPIHNTCLLPTWYPALIIQCALASIPLIFFLHRYPKIGFSMGVLMSAFILTSDSANSSRTLNSLHYFEMIRFMVAKYYTKRLLYYLPYLLGILGGRISIHFKEQQLSKVLCIAGWVLSLTIGVNVLRDGNASMLSLDPPSLDSAKRTFAICIAFFWIVHASIVDGVVGRILSSSTLSPLIRVSYIAYLMHTLLINVREAALKERIYIGNLTLAMEATSHTVLSFILGMIVHVIVEMPFARLCKMKKNQKDHSSKEYAEDHSEKEDSQGN